MSYKVRLDIFEGPLDLLLHLIQKEELSIYDIPVARVTEQYMETLSLMQLLDLDVAGEFLVMAATLIHIKSKMLLPPDPDAVEEEADPRAELVRRLIEYKAFKEAADGLRQREEKRSHIFPRFGVEPDIDGGDSPFMEVSLFDMIAAFSRVLKNFPADTVHEIGKDEFTVADKVHELFHLLVKKSVVSFSELFRASKNRYEVITIFLAVLELIRLKEVTVRQDSHFGEIEIARRSTDARTPSQRDGLDIETA